MSWRVYYSPTYTFILENYIHTVSLWLPCLQLAGQEIGSEVHLWQTSVNNNSKLWKFIKHDLKSSQRLRQKVLVYFQQLRGLIDTSNCGSEEVRVILSHTSPTTQPSPSPVRPETYKLSQPDTLPAKYILGLKLSA